MTWTAHWVRDVSRISMSSKRTRGVAGDKPPSICWLSLDLITHWSRIQTPQLRAAWVAPSRNSNGELLLPRRVAVLRETPINTDLCRRHQQRHAQGLTTNVPRQAAFPALFCLLSTEYPDFQPSMFWSASSRCLEASTK